MLEKPIALELWEADELIMLARRNNLKFTIGYSQRFNTKIAYAKKKIVDGTLGKVVSVLVSRHLSRGLGKKIASRVRLSPVVMESTHDLDFVMWLLEPAKPVRVYSQGAYGYMEPINGSHDVMFTTVTMDNGVVVMIGGGWNFPESYPNYCSTWIEITGTEGALVLDDTQRDNWLNTAKDGQVFPMSTMPGEQVDHVFAGGMGPETIHFLEACIQNKPVMVTPESARVVMETYTAADLSADCNAPVDLPLTNETIAAVADLKAKYRAGDNPAAENTGGESMRTQAADIGLAIIGGGRVGLFRGEVANRHPAVKWIGLAEKESESRRRCRAQDRRRFRHAEPRRADQAAGGDLRHHRDRRASARRADHGRGRARHTDPDREAARDRPRAIGTRAQSHQGRQDRRGGRLHPAVSPQMARRQGEGALRRAGRRHAGHLARVHESAGRHRQLQAHRRSEIDLADGDLRHPRARHVHVVPGKETPVECYARSIDKVLGPLYQGIDATAGMIMMSDNSVYHLNISWALPVTWPGAVYSLEVGIVGTDGVLTIDDTHRDMVLAVSKPQGEGYAPDQTRLVDFLGSYPPGDMALGELRGPMADETVSWLNRVALGLPTPAATVEEAHNNLMLTKALDLSAKRKQPVKLPLDPDEEKRAA